MTKFRRAQVAFTAGELDPRLKARRDANIFYLGAEHLRNSLVRPTGSTFVRPGLRYIATPDFDGAPCARLVTFVFNQQQRYLIWLGDGEAHVYRWPDNALISSFATPWTAAQIGAVDWIQIGDTVLLAHQAHPIQQIQRQLDGTFTTALYAFDFAPAGRIQPPPLRLHATALSGTTLMTSLDGPVFRPAYSTLGLAAPKVDIGGRWTFMGTGFEIVSVSDDGLYAEVNVLGAFPANGPSESWLEPLAQAWCGYWRAIGYFQDRLWLGGAASAPVALAASRTGAPYDFFGTSVDDDQPMLINIGAGQPEPILYLQPAAGGLEVYTTGSTGLIPGDTLQPITPSTVRYVPQTAFGSRPVKPVRLHSNTMFTQAGAGVLREMTYSDTEQVYRADPLAIRASHLVTDPVRVIAAPSAFGEQIDFVMLLNGSGKGAALTFEKSQEVAAWAEIVSERTILDWAAVGDRIYVATSNGTAAWLEFFDPAALFDSQMDVTLDEPGVTFAGFAHLAGRMVSVIADGYWLDSLAVGDDGVLTLSDAATTVSAGLPIDWLIQPMPPDSEQQAMLGRKVRPFRAEVRFHSSAALRVNGQPIHDRPFEDAITTPPQATSDVRRVTLTGWSNGASAPVTITRVGPFPVEILGFVIDYRVGSA